jgi:hypothetical protein
MQVMYTAFEGAVRQLTLPSPGIAPDQRLRPLVYGACDSNVCHENQVGSISFGQHNFTSIQPLTNTTAIRLE